MLMMVWRQREVRLTIHNVNYEAFEERTILCNVMLLPLWVTSSLPEGRA